MTGGTIVVGERELTVPNGCQGDHVYWAQEAINRGLQTQGNGNTVENCAFCNHSIVVNFKDGQPTEVKIGSKWR